ncbi:MAG: ABC transporter substrate-binding protein [Helicobacteraceae bacterium]|nr:ABC transporter substrate-binding protein [Candidatus Sulfurimonas ponti]
MSIKTLFIVSLFVLNLSANERIISLSPSLTEILFALEKKESIVATSSYSLHPQEAKKLPIIGGYQNPNLEKILSYLPTLVVGQKHNQALLDKLKHFNIQTLSLELKTLDDIKNSIATLAQATNSSQDKQLITNINNALKQNSKTNEPHSVMIVYGLREDLRRATYIAGHNIFFEDIIHACGHTNAYTQNIFGQPSLSYENIIATNPEQIIILHSLATEANVDVKKALENWYALPTKASKNKKISIVDEDYLHIPSHRVALTIERLCREMND